MTDDDLDTLHYALFEQRCDVDRSDLGEALYAASERGYFDDLSIEPSLALKIWSAVESVRKNGFPAHLRL